MLTQDCLESILLEDVPSPVPCTPLLHFQEPDDSGSKGEPLSIPPVPAVIEKTCPAPQSLVLTQQSQHMMPIQPFCLSLGRGPLAFLMPAGSMSSIPTAAIGVILCLQIRLLHKPRFCSRLWSHPSSHFGSVTLHLCALLALPEY